MKNLRILVADDHALVRRGARDVLHSRHGWRVVGEAANGREAVEKSTILQPDVAILDIAMPEFDGIEAARQIRSASPGTKILVLTMYESDYMVQSALDAGANGYLLKSDLTDTLVAAVKHVCEGQRFFTPKVVEIVQAGSFRGERRYQSGRTTPRERQIIRLLAEGKTNKEIAVALGISKRTAESHRANIMLKLQFSLFSPVGSLRSAPGNNQRSAKQRATKAVPFLARSALNNPSPLRPENRRTNRVRWLF